MEEAKRRTQAERKIRQREITRARILLTSSGLAPGSPETLAELRNRDLRPRELSERIPGNVLTDQPLTSLTLDRNHLLTALRTAGRGSAPDLAGMRYEHLRVLLDDDDDNLWQLFGAFAQTFGRADVLEEISTALRLGRMTALKKITAGCEV